LLLVFSFPKFELSWLAWVALAPLLYVLAQGVGLRRAFWLGWLAGLIFFFLATNWIAHSMINYGGILLALAYGVALLFASILALFPAVFATAVAQLVQAFGWRAVALAPVIWVGTEWLRAVVTGVTWNALGVSQAHHFAVARLAQYGGAYLVSWEVAAVSAVLILLFRIRQRVERSAAALLVIIGLAVLLLPQPPAQRGAVITVAGVQPDIPLTLYQGDQDSAQYFERLIALSRQALNQSPGKPVDLTIWAESPLILKYDEDLALRARLDNFAQETGSHLIFSAMAVNGEQYFNSAQTISPQPAALRRYDKMRLVPFGEYVPWRPLLGRFVPPMVGDFTPGAEAVVNLLRLNTERITAGRRSPETNDELDLAPPVIERTTDFVRVGTFICYEAAYPTLVRRFVQNGATLLVNISNDAWFGSTAGARQHLAHAVMRAIENDRELVRVTNSGITALIAADGRVMEPLPTFVAASHIWSAQARSGRTFYTRHGDWFAILCALFSGLAIIAGITQRARKES
jgi:apolipoprotein N-acyltransferase